MKQVISVIFSICLLFAGCGQKTEPSVADKKPLYVATTGMLGDALHELCGDAAEVVTLMGPGIDPHLYKATQQDIVKLKNADAIFYNGLHLESKMGTVLSKMGGSKPVIALGDKLSKELLINTTAFDGHADPHVWMSIDVWKEVVSLMGDELLRLHEIPEAQLKENIETYTGKLLALNMKLKERVTKIPEEQRVLITAHDAFGYLGRDYGITVRGLQGISTATEPGLKDITSLVDFIQERGIAAIFVESSVSEKSIQAVMEGCESRGHQVKLGGVLYSDAMGDKGTPEGTYLGMIEHNIFTIVKGLTGDE